jgi:hypothetical protein
MFAKTQKAMEMIAFHGANKMGAQGYEVEFAGVAGAYFVGKTENGTHTCYIVDRAEGTCQCAFFEENQPVYGDAATCKHRLFVERFVEAEDARIAELEAEQERREEYRFDADPFH